VRALAEAGTMGFLDSVTGAGGGGGAVASAGRTDGAGDGNVRFVVSSPTLCGSVLPMQRFNLGKSLWANKRPSQQQFFLTSSRRISFPAVDPGLSVSCHRCACCDRFDLFQRAAVDDVATYLGDTGLRHASHRWPTTDVIQLPIAALTISEECGCGEDSGESVTSAQACPRAPIMHNATSRCS
jgi:hypothetical protein